VQLQLPLWQVLPPEQTVPQAPQLELSVAGVMQVAPHESVPAGQPVPPVPVEPPLPVAPPLELPPEPLTAEVPPVPVPDCPDENDPHETATAPRNMPRNATMDTRMRGSFFIGNLQAVEGAEK
jgi:hypothetical protein